MLLQTLATLALGYLAIGALIWILNDPAAYLDSAVRSYLRIFGRLPPRIVLVLSVGFAIVLWPKVVAVMFRATRGAR